MPNNVKNIIKMKGIASLPLFRDLEDGTRAFDFNKLIPMPPELDIESGTICPLAIEAALRKAKNNIPTFSRIHISPGIADPIYYSNLRSSGKTEDELCFLGLQYLSNLIKYGSPSWYYWCCDNWGTKWNSYADAQENDDVITFKTTWDPPFPIIKKLSELYPNIEIEHFWANENIGYETGYGKWKNGEAIQLDNYEAQSQEAYQTYILCWGPCDYLRQNENGEWVLDYGDEED